MFAPVAGLLRALDVVAPDYQKGGQDFIAGWNANTGQFSPGFPAVNNDLSFITGETIGDVTGEAPTQEVLAGTASQDLQAYNATGAAASTRVAEADRRLARRDAGARLARHGRHRAPRAKKDVVSITRSGTLSVYSTPAVRLLAELVAELPPRHRQLGRLHARRDRARRAAAGERRRRHAELDGARRRPHVRHRRPRYEIVTSASPITPQNFAAATPLRGAPAPAAAGHGAELRAARRRRKRYVAIRAIDEQGNIGLPAVAPRQIARRAGRDARRRAGLRRRSAPVGGAPLLDLGDEAGGELDHLDVLGGRLVGLELARAGHQPGEAGQQRHDEDHVQGEGQREGHRFPSVAFSLQIELRRTGSRQPCSIR